MIACLLVLCGSSVYVQKKRSYSSISCLAAGVSGWTDFIVDPLWARVAVVVAADEDILNLLMRENVLRCCRGIFQ